MRPQRREDHLVIEELDGELLVYDQTRHQAHALNATSALVWRHCDGRHTVRELAGVLQTSADTPHAEEVVWLSLQQLDRIHLLQPPLPAPAERPRISRRELGRKLTAAGKVGLLLPLITSIIAPTAAEAATCIASSGCVPGVDTCKPCGPPACDRRCDPVGQCSNAVAGC